MSIDTLKWKKIDPKEIEDNLFELINDDWMALAVGKEGDMNAITISSGSFGNMWRMPIVAIYISPNRYTHSFMERNKHFTVTEFDKSYRDKLQYLGSHSGQKSDKIKDAGLAVKYTELGNPKFTTDV